MNRLGTTVAFYSDETVVSFCSRLAVANGVASVREFCWYIGIDFQKIRTGDAVEVGRLMALAGLSSHVAERRSVRRVDALSPAEGETISIRSFSSARLRYCPRCLQEDVANGTGPEATRPYGRVLWCVG
ncbi:TniQ family protein, partial [Rhizobium ecuadorense]